MTNKLGAYNTKRSNMGKGPRIYLAERVERVWIYTALTQRDIVMAGSHKSQMDF